MKLIIFSGPLQSPFTSPSNKFNLFTCSLKHHFSPQRRLLWPSLTVIFANYSVSKKTYVNRYLGTNTIKSHKLWHRGKSLGEAKVAQVLILSCYSPFGHSGYSREASC